MGRSGTKRGKRRGKRDEKREKPGEEINYLTGKQELKKGQRGKRRNPHPEPLFREGSPPVLLCVGGHIFKLKYFLPPLHKSRGEPPSHAHLPVGLKYLKLGEKKGDFSLLRDFGRFGGF